MTDNLLDESDEQVKPLPASFKTLATFAYLGNGFWSVLFMIFFFLVVTDSNVLLAFFRFKVENEALMAVIYLLAMIFCIIPIAGVIKMSRQNRNGFALYVVPNAIWILYCFWLQNPITIAFGLLSITFIFMFGSFLKYMEY
ncbi:MAG: hypothetical protein HYZ14_06410 [Bacteroidetes bacterium]|nr:hypothetical protein [Bacteroidota bacterium]